MNFYCVFFLTASALNVIAKRLHARILTPNEESESERFVRGARKIESCPWARFEWVSERARASGRVNRTNPLHAHKYGGTFDCTSTNERERASAANFQCVLSPIFWTMREHFFIRFTQINKTNTSAWRTFEMSVTITVVAAAAVEAYYNQLRSDIFERFLSSGNNCICITECSFYFCFYCLHLHTFSISIVWRIWFIERFGWLFNWWINEDDSEKFCFVNFFFQMIRCKQSINERIKLLFGRNWIENTHTFVHFRNIYWMRFTKFNCNSECTTRFL